MLARCKKTIALISLVTGSLYTGNILAVGLGELTVNSSLNEPLDATIQVLGLDGLNENQIAVSLGSLDDFRRANIARVGLIDDIELEIDILNREEGILHLTTDEAVTEPFLNMVISMRWPNGRLMRDYTALIDLPVFFTDEPQTVPVNVPESPDPAPAPQQTAPRSQFLAEDAPQAPRPTAPAPPTASGDDVVIEAGDTLYDIAAANRPSNNVSVEQTMLAIQRANPDAFIDNDINRIRVGRILRIPSLQEIQSIDQSQAVNQIALQNQTSPVQPLAFSNNNAGGGQQGNDELTILSGDEGTASLSGDSDMAATIAALENQLAISEENLDRARLENQELRTRFAELEEQIEILQNIIAMQDARLAQLQADLASAQTAPTPEPPAAANNVAAQPAAAPAAAPQDNSLMGQLSAVFENTLVLVSSLAALIVLVVGFLVWRRRAAQDDMDDFALAGATVAGGRQATYNDDDDVGGTAGFLAALKSRFSRKDDEDDEDVAVAEDADDDDDDDDDGGLMGKLKGLFSRSSDDDDDDYEEDEDDGYDDDEDDEDEFDDSPDGDAGASAFALDDEDEESEDAVATAEDEFDLDFDDEDDADDGEEPIGELALDDDTDDDDFDLGNLDFGDDKGDTGSGEKAAATSAAGDATPDVFDFDLGDSDDAGTDDGDSGDSLESFDFSLDDTPKAQPAPAADNDVESFEFSISDTPAPQPSASVDEPDDVETFEFDVGSVSSFEEKQPASAGADDEVETFDFDLGDSSTAKDPLGSALDDVDADEADEDDDVFDLGNIEIDDSMFDTDKDAGGERDESSTKLDLAIAYEAMGDMDGAREILNEVIAEGSEAQSAEAKKLLEKWGEA